MIDVFNLFKSFFISISPYSTQQKQQKNKTQTPEALLRSQEKKNNKQIKWRKDFEHLLQNTITNINQLDSKSTTMIP